MMKFVDDDDNDHDDALYCRQHQSIEVVSFDKTFFYRASE